MFLIILDDGLKTPLIHMIYSNDHNLVSIWFEVL
jgi:hypothetical protein